MPKTPSGRFFYAVHRGRRPGVYPSWSACQSQVSGVKGAVYKKFSTAEEAESFVQNGRTTTTHPLIRKKSAKNMKAHKPTKRLAWPFVPPLDFKPDHTVYTDGGYRKVSASKKKLASMGVYFGPNDARNVSSLILPQHTFGCTKQTNNVGELCAILEALRLLEMEVYTKKETLLIGTDSQYAIRCATTYGVKCAPGGVKEHDTSVPNRALVLALYNKITQAEGRVQFLHIPAHTDNNDVHSIGNREADALATQALTE